ncbi:uncharacterized protein IAS62_006238 [Cryptococcus decagattii]|uniref:Uncharacterized protein n=1 Tax=Cryptococcus decagattii TaxID=1859122 RepID=A0ABZ2B387_9TREE
MAPSTDAGPEPWADGLDEIDEREWAMGRFRRRQEVLGEVFVPETLNSWEGLGMSGETLEQKVLALEKENEECSGKWRKKPKGGRGG